MRIGSHTFNNGREKLEVLKKLKDGSILELLVFQVN